MAFLGDLALIGGITSAGVTLGGVVFHLGKLSAKVESLEAWRGNIRNDFHEVDHKLEDLANEVGRLGTVIEERTERRTALRIPVTG